MQIQRIITVNKSILADLLFRGWILLPHCQRNRRKHLKDVRSRFNYNKLSDISIFCTNCVGGILYHFLGIPFRSPLINTSMDRNQFVVFCTSLKQYLDCELLVSKNEKGSCTGKIGGNGLDVLTIEFPHDSDPDVVIEKWKKRVGRVNYDKLVLICDDRGMKEESFREFDKIRAFRKILFTADDRSRQYPWCHQLMAYQGEEEVGDYNGKTLNGMWKFQTMWDYVSFLNGTERKIR